MTSFLTHRARVHDERLPARRRFNALRTCLTCFAPYGFRATYHHLTLSARMPRLLEADPDSLVRAVEELHEARVLWLAGAQEYAARRRAEKRAGRRQPPEPVWWNRPWWGAPDAAWRADPFLHPPLRLPDYVRRQNALLDGAELPGCPACGDEEPVLSRSTGHGLAELCRTCAWVRQPCPCGRWHSFEPALRVGWNRIWQRQHLIGDATPNPRWPGVQGPARVERLAVYEVSRPWGFRSARCVAPGR
ncbi:MULTISPECIES: hypothetical protein [unclassified Kitasatospora]|uniref:hypothetical protein n=1 Tax=unclassified Kitasatospora TaxID=2633591 RepID=UPI003437C313